MHMTDKEKIDFSGEIDGNTDSFRSQFGEEKNKKNLAAF